MYMEIADMTLEQLASITSMLSHARLGAYMGKVSGHTYLFAIPQGEYEASLGMNLGISEM